jgi:2'-5' RNA ligase
MVAGLANQDMNRWQTAEVPVNVFGDFDPVLPELIGIADTFFPGRCQPLFSLSIEGTGCFPHARRPRVLWAGISQGVQEVCALHDALEAPLLELGYCRREERAYTPHITLGRVKPEQPVRALAPALARQADWRGGETLVQELLVLGSDRTPQGPIYTILGRGRLKS